MTRDRLVADMANGFDLIVDPVQPAPSLVLHMMFVWLVSVCNSCGPGPVSATIIAPVPGPATLPRLLSRLVFMQRPPMVPRSD